MQHIIMKLKKDINGKDFELIIIKFYTTNMNQFSFEQKIKWS